MCSRDKLPPSKALDVALTSSAACLLLETIDSLDKTHVFLSFDIDSITGADCPGVSCPGAFPHPVDVAVVPHCTHTELMHLLVILLLSCRCLSGLPCVCACVRVRVRVSMQQPLVCLRLMQSACASWRGCTLALPSWTSLS